MKKSPISSEQSASDPGFEKYYSWLALLVAIVIYIFLCYAGCMLLSIDRPQGREASMLLANISQEFREIALANRAASKRFIADTGRKGIEYEKLKTISLDLVRIRRSGNELVQSIHADKKTHRTPEQLRVMFEPYVPELNKAVGAHLTDPQFQFYFHDALVHIHELQNFIKEERHADSRSH